MGFFDEVYKIVKMIPRGKVANYGQIARLAGNGKMARQVGWALHVNPEPGVIPCHRVVMKDGRLTKSFAFGGIDIQKQLLESEGVVVGIDNKVDMTKYKWNTEDSYENWF
ncbi:MAG: MGMT family protein [Clostridia bacterium]|nr:MGMT family protein [Clostridia bacterium]